jgi:glycosyltransferase involved in cell wall biosynthesis
MIISVIICTFNRCSNLPSVLECLAKQRGVEDVEWEVVVVDNNSTDSTRDVVKDLADRLPIRIHYAFEKQQGLNHARNRGIDESRGEIFIYIDDDILVSSGWLAAMYRAVVDNDADAVGGRIHLDKGIHLPEWVRPDMYGFLGYQDLGDKPFRMDGIEQHPFGGNMGFNRRIVDKIGRFNPLLGRKGEGKKRDELFKGAETDLLHRLAKAGGKIYYVPEAVVYHEIKPFQLTKRYFRTIHFNHGYQEAFFDDCKYGRTLHGVPLFVFRQTIRQGAKYIRELISNGRNYAFRQQMTLGYFVGRIKGYSSAYRRS